MRFTFSFHTALRGLRAHKSRSALTILGIVIGITSIMLVVSLGQGAQNLILSQVQGIGARTIAVVPGRQPKGPTDFVSMFTDSLKSRDVDALLKKQNAPYISDIMPVVFGGAAASHEGETYRPTIFGVSELFADFYDVTPAEGRNMTPEEARGYADVVILGHKVADELGQGNDLLGGRIKIKDRNLLVIGILAAKGGASFIDFDEAAIMPYSTAQRYIFGIKYFNRLAIRADTEADVPQTVLDIQTTLRNQHNITDPTKDDFFVETQAQAMEIVGTITTTLTLFLAAVAGISLVVGGVGIMNIMLVSVTERTREIGLRKALGATERNILVQFLLEAVLLTAIGGLIGIALGALFSFLATLVLRQALATNLLFAFPLKAAALGLGVAAGIGLVFGIYPARQAAKKDPIEALRYE